MVAGIERAPDGRQARWTRHNRERRQEILDAAVSVLEESQTPEFHVQQIAERAGISRTVIYRHFSDRADLDQAVQAHAVDALRSELLPMISFEGTPREIVRRVVATYVRWAVAHPHLHEFVHQNPRLDGESEMDAAVRQVAEMVEDLLQSGAQLLQAGFDADQQAAIDPMVFGLIGGVVTGVRRWMNRGPQAPDVDTFIDLISQGVWIQIRSMAQLGGVTVDPDVPVERLFLDGGGAAG